MKVVAPTPLTEEHAIQAQQLRQNFGLSPIGLRVFLRLARNGNEPVFLKDFGDSLGSWVKALGKDYERELFVSYKLNGANALQLSTYGLQQAKEWCAYEQDNS